MNKLFFVDNADTINATSIQVGVVTNKTGAVHIHWDDPPAPNGLIVTYEIEYSKSNLQNVSHMSEDLCCINCTDILVVVNLPLFVLVPCLSNFSTKKNYLKVSDSEFYYSGNTYS